MALVPASPLSDGVVVVRAATPVDEPPFVAAFREDPDLGRLLGYETDPDERGARERAGDLAQAAAEGRAADLAIVDPRSGAWVGGVLVHHVAERHRRCELGFMVAPAHRRRGVAGRALALVLDWLFDTRGMERVELSTTPDNDATRALALRLGFTEEGTLRARDVERGRRVDVVWFGLLADEWRRGRAGEERRSRR